jgi:hypothetical protein
MTGIRPQSLTRNLQRDKIHYKWTALAIRKTPTRPLEIVNDMKSNDI